MRNSRAQVEVRVLQQVFWSSVVFVANQIPTKNFQWILEYLKYEACYRHVTFCFLKSFVPLKNFSEQELLVLLWETLARNLIQFLLIKLKQSRFHILFALISTQLLNRLLL